MKIKCPRCNGKAELADDFSFVRCDPCSLDMTYGEYVKIIAYKDHTYSDILGDYVSSTEGTKAGSLDDW